MKAILFRVAAVLISFLIVALFGEVALRLFLPGGGKPISERNTFCRFDHELGWVPLENISHFDKKNGAGHALFAKFVTDTDLARASVDYYAHK